MTEPRPLEATVLALLCRPAQNADLIPGLSDADWTQILDWGREHRFLPYLQYALRQAGALSYVPADVQEKLSAAYRHSALRALTRQGDMIGTHRALDRAGIDHVFLKGAYLAQFAYPEPGLRPLRDIDVLVPKPQALEAYAALQAAGFARDPHYQGHAEAFLEGVKHLPRLVSPMGGTALELHTQLTDSTRYRDDEKDLRAQAVMASALPRSLAAHTLHFQAPEDLLLHLCIHAVYEHQFNNGPLILSDLHWLIATQAIDWTKVWSDANEQGVTRGLALTLKLLEREWPAGRDALQSGSPRLASVDPDIVDEAARMVFRNFEARADVALLDDLGTRTSSAARLLHLLGKAFPTRSDLARQFSVSPGSISILKCYPMLWGRLLRQRLPEFVSAMRDQKRRSEVRSLAKINGWLAGQ